MHLYEPDCREVLIYGFAEMPSTQRHSGIPQGRERLQPSGARADTPVYRKEKKCFERAGSIGVTPIIRE
jgi:hypothetical protein